MRSPGVGGAVRERGLVTARRPVRAIVQTTGTIPVFCAWCGAHLGGPATPDAPEVSHGCCPTCYSGLLSELDESPDPERASLAVTAGAAIPSHLYICRPAAPGSGS